MGHGYVEAMPTLSMLQLFADCDLKLVDMHAASPPLSSGSCLPEAVFFNPL